MYRPVIPTLNNPYNYMKMKLQLPFAGFIRDH